MLLRRLLRAPLDYCLVVAVQSVMLLQVGFFDVMRRIRGRRLKHETLAQQPSSTPPPPSLTTISVVVPTFNEARSIGRCLEVLQRGAEALARVQVVIVDAGCTDGTMALVGEWAAACPEVRVVTTTATGGRGPAVAAGVRLATGDALMVLHADTALPPKWDTVVLTALGDPSILMTAFSFGCDRAQLSQPDAPPVGLALMEWTVNKRSRWCASPLVARPSQTSFT
jgi:cellulose synthase/poly-beta-1,6-N-acetylglucosamine synthase-like glycosyltransferase